MSLPPPPQQPKRAYAALGDYPNTLGTVAKYQKQAAMDKIVFIGDRAACRHYPPALLLRPIVRYSFAVNYKIAT
jgi:hypothetical protein